MNKEEIQHNLEHNLEVLFNTFIKEEKIRDKGQIELLQQYTSFLAFAIYEQFNPLIKYTIKGINRLDPLTGKSICAYNIKKWTYHNK